MILIFASLLRFGRKLAVIRGEVEREIQALVSKRDNVQTYHQYHAWDPVPSLSAASPGNAKIQPLLHVALLNICIHVRPLVITAGTLISHEKLLLQINTERELGNMDYKLGQVRNVHQRVD